MAPASAAPALNVESATVRKWFVNGKALVTEEHAGKYQLAGDFAYAQVSRDRLKELHAALGKLLTDTVDAPPEGDDL
jgi:predicted site-specific integrase-resolvase